MSSSKFAASRRPGKTPAICRKSQKPKLPTIPDGDHPIIHPKPLLCSIEWKSINPAHPWYYSAMHRLFFVGRTEWFSDRSQNPQFAIEVHFWYAFAGPNYRWESTINHQHHGDHVATSNWRRYQGGNAVYLPRTQLETSPYPRYQCYVGVTL